MSLTYVSAALRKLVYDRAKGACEYCLIDEENSFARHQIDHVIAEKHGGLTVKENLALSCTLCNKYKGSASRPLTGTRAKSFRSSIRETMFGAIILYSMTVKFGD